MITLLFLAMIILFGFQATYFALRFVVHLKEGKVVLASILCALNTTGWVLAVSRELHFLPRWGAAPILALGFCVGMVGVLCILHTESQRP